LAGFLNKYLLDLLSQINWATNYSVWGQSHKTFLPVFDM
jgi:hypothetical protein